MYYGSMTTHHHSRSYSALGTDCILGILHTIVVHRDNENGTRTLDLHDIRHCFVVKQLGTLRSEEEKVAPLLR